MSLVAQKDEILIGHILLTKIKIIDPYGNYNDSLALAPMAVRASSQNFGIGNQLIKTGLDQAKKLGFQSIIDLGHENYHPRFGFIPANQLKVRAPFDFLDKAFMRLSLKEVSGKVMYEKEF